MARTKLIQILLRVPAPTADRLAHLSRVTGISKNKLMTRLLEEVFPDLDQAADVLSEAKQGASVRAIAAMRSAVARELTRRGRSMR